ncbi:copia protein [Tanacetum coccineum]
MSDNEDKYHDIILDLEAKAKENENVVIKRVYRYKQCSCLVQNVCHFYDPNLKHGLGYENPYALKKAISQNPKIYDASSFNDTKIHVNVRDTEDIINDATKSQIKTENKFNDPIAIEKKQNVRTIDYNKLNALYEDFVQQIESSAKQKYFSSSFISFEISSNESTLTSPSESNASSASMPRLKAATSVRRPSSRDSPSKNSVLSNTKNSSEKVEVSIRTHKKTNVASKNVVSRKHIVIDVDAKNALKAKNVLYVSCSKRVLIPCHDEYHANYKLNVHSKVRRALFTTPRSKSVNTTPIVSKTMFAERTAQSKTLDTTHVVSKTKVVQIFPWIVDSGCLKHMTSLRHNLFSVGQFCDGDLEVAFRSKTCYVRNMEGDDLLTGARESNLYTISISDMAASSPVCLMMYKGLKTKQKRLSHLNFDTINDLTKHDLVDGLPKFKYNKEHLCSACERGKIKKSSHPPKLVPSTHSKLELLHMDLCRPMRVETISGKKYISVIVDDYSRFTVFNELTTMAFYNIADSEPVPTQLLMMRVVGSSTAISSIPSKADLDNLFGTMYEEYFEKRSPEVSINSATQPVHANEESPSLSSTIVEEQEAPSFIFKPKNIKEAMSDHSWIESMQDELHQFERLNVWELVPRPDGKNIIVGYKQEEGIDFEESFASVSRLEAVKMLKKALYGLKEAPRAWYDKLSSFLIEHHLLKKHAMDDCVSMRTPMATEKLDADLLGTPSDQKTYHRMIRGLMYLIASRPDIAFAIFVCARYQARPMDSGFEIIAYSDADHAGCKDDCKSTLAEAEYVSLSACCAQVIWMRTQLLDYGYKYNKIPMYCDSKSAIAISCNLVQHSRTKHINIRYHFIKEHVEKETVE